MKTSDFEKQLQSQAMRSVPQEWRAEVLLAARAAAPAISEPKPVFRAWFYELLWPSPRAWASVAAVWALMLVVNFVPITNESRSLASGSGSVPENKTALREQFRLRAELIGSMDAPFFNSPREGLPHPRSERNLTVMLV